MRDAVSERLAFVVEKTLKVFQLKIVNMKKRSIVSAE